MPTAEHRRLRETYTGQAAWRRWGPYLAERQWATVREDYSPDGSAWEYFPFDAARSRVYRWGEDGIAGFSDDQVRLCLCLALWNGRDPILKERLFGLTGPQGNHGEDVKELYYYLDAMPTHSYLKMLYKYPQAAFPYKQLVEENRRRTRQQGEFELIDTGVFDENRYFDVFVEYAKAGPDEILMRITAHNRGPEQAVLHLLPQIWFRNTWSWGRGSDRPALSRSGPNSIQADHPELHRFTFYSDGEPELLFCDNETNTLRLFGFDPGPGHYFKDGINDCVVNGRREAVNAEATGTKAAIRYQLSIPAGGQAAIRLRLVPDTDQHPFDDFEEVFDIRQREADHFHEQLQNDLPDADARLVHRQAMAGMIWNKQYYYWDIPQWLEGDPAQPPPPPQRRDGRDSDWVHVNNADILSMPDKWEFPYYATWDLGFQCLPLAMMDPQFAKEQLVLICREWYMHPNGQVPGSEWSLSDVNPPVQAWAAWRVFEIDRQQHGGDGDLAFLERVFHKLLLNFTWWVNRKDVAGRNIFQGGFLGFDNIGVFDRSARLPTGGYLNQADATSWMAMYSLNLMRIALELARHNPVYQDVATKFFEHFLYIAAATTNIGGQRINLWNEEDQFFYDVLSLPDGRSVPLKLRSIVGLLPLFAVEVLEPEHLREVPEFRIRLKWFMNYRPDLANLVSRWHEPGLGERRLLSLLRGHRMKQLLKRMLDETEFLSPYGVRALSRYHLDHPYVFNTDGQHIEVHYVPGESETSLFGGNSNWRGPIWMPVNFLIVESLRRFHTYYGDDFKVECPTHSGTYLTLDQIADELTRRLARIFLADDQGRRPVLGYSERMQTDPHFRDYVPFHEYFHGDTGRGCGASHQTGWTGLVSLLLQPCCAAALRRRPERPELETVGSASST